MIVILENACLDALSHRVEQINDEEGGDVLPLLLSHVDFQYAGGIFMLEW